MREFAGKEIRKEAQHGARMDSHEAPGKRTRVEQLLRPEVSAVVQQEGSADSDVQRKAADSPGHESVVMDASGPGARLPFHDTFLRVFGRHDGNGEVDEHMKPGSQAFGGEDPEHEEEESIVPEAVTSDTNDGIEPSRPSGGELLPAPHDAVASQPVQRRLDVRAAASTAAVLAPEGPKLPEPPTAPYAEPSHSRRQRRKQQAFIDAVIRKYKQYKDWPKKEAEVNQAAKNFATARIKERKMEFALDPAKEREERDALEESIRQGYGIVKLRKKLGKKGRGLVGVKWEKQVWHLQTRLKEIYAGP